MAIDRRTFLTATALGGVGLVAGCAQSDQQAPPTTPPSGITTIADGLNVPWAMAFLAGGDALVTQRDDAAIVRVSPTGQVTTIGDVAGVAPRGEGGLQGIALAPGDESGVYVYYTTASDNRVARMDFDGRRLGPPQPLLTGLDTAPNHHGGALLFDAAGSLFVAVGDAAQPEVAQDVRLLNGKILRIDRAGRPWPGNPFGNAVYSYGHRNVEGLAFDSAGRLWATEFGQNERDELNLIVRGRNYGWPIHEGESDDPAYVAPQVTWSTDEASPAGLAIVGDTAYVAALRGRRLWTVPLRDGRAGSTSSRFDGELGRLRAVEAAPDGSLWISTSNTDGRGASAANDDRILRVPIG
ncbi:PQQ-dependent sugar dehydrogenase [Gordonia sp. ABSL49_1]|nr:PQQ-dependent sugar dehydrogenase [Gordonia sp. ABSL49_1]MCH5644292.1 PQQ-dependent sugar dehydrogenase [Gordonia sp. ABSL49_1]